MTCPFASVFNGLPKLREAVWASFLTQGGGCREDETPSCRRMINMPKFQCDPEVKT